MALSRRLVVAKSCESLQYGIKTLYDETVGVYVI